MRNPLLREFEAPVDKSRRGKDSGGNQVFPYYQRVIRSFAIVTLSAFFIFILAVTGACSSDELSSPTPDKTTPSPDISFKPLPTTATQSKIIQPTAEPEICEIERTAIQKALDSYHAANGTWPTKDGQPGPIVWELLMPQYLEAEPATIDCGWEVSSNPEGRICQTAYC